MKTILNPPRWDPHKPGGTLEWPDMVGAEAPPRARSLADMYPAERRRMFELYGKPSAETAARLRAHDEANRCKKHPRYMAKKTPISKCEKCEGIYARAKETR